MTKLCFIAALGFGALALAQRPAWNFQGGGFRGLLQGKVVTNEPYSGVGVSSSKRTLNDGNTINEVSCVKVYRDSSGRTRREETSNSSTCSATPQTILIIDPVAGVQYSINTQQNTYRQFTFKPRSGGGTPPVGARPSTPNQVSTACAAQPVSGTALTAECTQTVTTIPAGRFGNGQPITITSTRLYSPDLQIVIQSTRTDPRNGVTTYQLSNVSTAEPAESLFQLPSGLTLQQGPARGPNGRGRRAQ